MNENFWPDLAGGGLEQVGATQAVNELLLQSFVSRPICARVQLLHDSELDDLQEGFLRFFPGWPLGEAASFSTLRAVGAFLVSATVDAAGVVGGVVVRSERGEACTVLNPFAAPPKVEDGAGRSVAARGVGGGKFEFATVAGATYRLS